MTKGTLASIDFVLAGINVAVYAALFTPVNLGVAVFCFGMGLVVLFG